MPDAQDQNPQWVVRLTPRKGGTSKAFFKCRLALTSGSESEIRTCWWWQQVKIRSASWSVAGSGDRGADLYRGGIRV
jgi:hypothetical protein